MRDHRPDSTAVADFCTRAVVHVETLQSVAEAARLMREHHVGSVVIVEHDGSSMRPIGMITDRDIAVAVVAQGLDPASTPAIGVMGTGVVSIGEGEGVDRALELMRAKGVRRLPVVDPAGLLVGIITADDLIDFVAGETSGLSEMLGRELARERMLRPEGHADVAGAAAARY